MPAAPPDRDVRGGPAGGVKPETVVLLPGHGLDDLPESLPAADAAGVLHAFALAWHPALLASARALPLLKRADQPPRPLPHRRFLVPACVRNRLPEGWLGDAGETAAVIGADRGEGLTAVEARSRDRQGVGPGDADHGTSVGGEGPLADARGSGEVSDPAPFFALGLGHVWCERLTRRTHYYSTLDETRLRVEAVAAADAWAAGDAAKLRARLTEAAEILREARERFYPTPASFHDLLFVIPRLAAALPAELAGPHPANVLATGADWRQIEEADPAVIAAVKGSGACVVGGEEREVPPALRDLTATLGDIEAGRETVRSLFGSPPGVWGRRQFGVSPLTPQLAVGFGYAGALRPNFGGGAFLGKDDAAGGRGVVRWAGAEGEIAAHARDPLPAGDAAAWWRLPEVLADAFEREQTVALTFARWPGGGSCWLDDLKALTALAPVLGEFRTYDDLFAEPDPFARLLAADPRLCRSFELEATVAAGAADPVGSHVAAVRSDADDRDDAVFAGLAGLLDAPASGGRRPPVRTTGDAAARLAAFVTRGGGDVPGTLLLNPLPVARVVGVADRPAPAGHPAVRTVGPAGFTAELPPCGFAWFPDAPAGTAAVSKTKAKTAELGVIRNEFFEVRLDETAGGIASVKTYGRAPNRLGVRPCVRFPTPRPGRDGEPTVYADAVRTGWSVPYAGPDRGEVRSEGELRDPADGSVLARFVLDVRLWRGARMAEVRLTFRDVAYAPNTGAYDDFLGVRWAWDDETADLSRSLQGTRQAAPAAGTFEAPHFFELTTLNGDAKDRTAVLTGGACFHVRRGARMCDTPLLVAGETRGGERTWTFGIAVDDPHPMRAADALLSRPRPVPCPGPPAGGPVGWLLACDAPGVRVLAATPRADGSAVVRLQESDGRSREPRVRFFKAPVSAERRTLGGEPAGELRCEGDAVVVPLAGYELCDVLIHW